MIVVLVVGGSLLPTGRVASTLAPTMIVVLIVGGSLLPTATYWPGTNSRTDLGRPMR